MSGDWLEGPVSHPNGRYMRGEQEGETVIDLGRQRDRLVVSW